MAELAYDAQLLRLGVAEIAMQSRLTVIADA